MQLSLPEIHKTFKDIHPYVAVNLLALGAGPPMQAAIAARVFVDIVDRNGTVAAASQLPQGHPQHPEADH